MKYLRKCCAFLLLLSILLMAGGCGDDIPASMRDVKAAVGSSAPDFELENLAGELVLLSEYRGKVVVLNFWATWCGPCRLELPILKGLPSKYAEDELVILAVDQAEPQAEVAAFAEKNELPFTVLLDLDMRVSAAYKTRSIPTTFIIDADGVIRYKRTGTLIPNELDLAIRPLIAAGKLSQ